jgi:hypothetical protein
VPKLELKIRRIETGEVLVAGFDDVEAATRWLQERPPFVEVLRVVSSIEPDTEAKLRAAMRPFDAAEVARVAALEAEQQAAREAEIERLRAEAEAAREAEQPSDDPDRPMVLRWAERKGAWHADDGDDRAIPATVRLAIDAWVEERNEWVRGRDQHVATAILTVYPAAVPTGSEDDRIAPGGKFVTASGPPMREDA